MKFTFEIRTDVPRSRHKLWTMAAVNSLINTSKGRPVCIELGIQLVGRIREALLIAEYSGKAVIEIDVELNEDGQRSACLLKNRKVDFSYWTENYEWANETGDFPHIDRILDASLDIYWLYTQEPCSMNSLPACENALILK